MIDVKDTEYPWYRYAYFTFVGRQYLAEMIDINAQRKAYVNGQEVVVVPVMPQIHPVEVNIYTCTEGNPEQTSVYRKRYSLFKDKTIIRSIMDFGRKNTKIF